MEEHTPKGISRRSMLKRVGAGAAVAWSAPILTSIRTPAFAQFYVCDPGCPECQFGAQCGPNCACVGVPDNCFCSNLGACRSPDPICRTDADCEQICAGGVCAECIFDPSCAETSCWCPCSDGPRRIPRGRRVRVIRPRS